MERCRYACLACYISVADIKVSLGNIYTESTVLRSTTVVVAIRSLTAEKVWTSIHGADHHAKSASQSLVRN